MTIKQLLWGNLVFLLAIIAIQSPVLAQKAPQTENPVLKNLRWRSIGPYRGGRSAAVTGVPQQPDTYYFGATGGGVWKTTSGGANWQPITDGQIGTGSVGAIAVSEADPNVIYLGMGESTIRGNVSHGDGVYKSTDAGSTWKHLGLTDTRQVPRIRIHPRNPDIVYVAALGHTFGPNEQRGVFRSTDGGKNWQRILYRNAKTGAIDLVIDPNNSNVLYAGLWEVYRTPYSLESGGPGSGIFKSTDGGDNWTEITRNAGLPKGTIGNIGLTVSPVDSNRVWAIVEAEEGGVFRSDNAGKTWSRVNESRDLRQRAWYYSRIYADPQNLDSVYVLNVLFFKSNDGGRNFNRINVPHGDNHDLWIAPNDARRMINANDGGANVSYNGGNTWTAQDQATAQFYRVALDNDFPYNIYGAQQDNSTVKIPSRTMGAVISEQDWYDVGGGESGWIAPHPKDSNITFAGSYDGFLTRYDRRTGQTRDITIWPDNPIGYGAESLKYRFQWNFPLIYSQHSDTLYAAANVLFKSTDEGGSWEEISPDLTRNDKARQKSSGGPITKDNTSVEYYCTIFALAESPLQPGLLWAGSDDGLVHITRDGGKSWQKITPPNMPEWIQINAIDASPHDPATAYVAATMYKMDDFRPYLYKTTDYGKTWQTIVNGLPNNSFTRVVREDPNRRGLLYAGTETGIYVSFNDGQSWQSLQLNLPAVPITDLAIHKRDKDLVIATQGRSFWILDNLNVIHQYNDIVNSKDFHLFAPEEAYRLAGFGFSLSTQATVGENLANGLILHFYLKESLGPDAKITLEFFDQNNKLVKSFTGVPKTDTPRTQPDDSQKPTFAVEPGLNRFVWNFRTFDATSFPGIILWAGSTQGPRVPPGQYEVRLTVNGQTLSQSCAVRKDPRINTTSEDFAKQYELGLKMRDKVTDMHKAILRIREIRGQLESLNPRLSADAPETKDVVTQIGDLKKKITAIEEELYQTKLRSSQDPLNFPIKLNNKMTALAEVIDGEYAPTRQAFLVYQDLLGRIDQQLQQLQEVLKNDLPKLNQLARDKNLPLVMLMPEKEAAK